MVVRRRSAARQPVSAPAQEVGGWRSLLFAPLGDGQRRRGSDGRLRTITMLGEVLISQTLLSGSRCCRAAHPVGLTPSEPGSLRHHHL